MKKLLRFAVQLIFPTRRPLNKFIKSISNEFVGLDIIEIGSGNDALSQSSKIYFKNPNTFIKTDINKGYDHMYLDITKELTINEKFDLVICNYVLEHIFEVKKAIFNLTQLLKENGQLLIAVPMIYPLHDEPADFWRFTEHSLKKLFNEFTILKFKHTGLRQFPSQYILLLEQDKKSL